MGYELDVERLIDAPTGVVYRARTDIDTEREITCMFDSTSELRGEVRTGGRRVAEWGPEDDRYRVTQTFLESGGSLPGRDLMKVDRTTTSIMLFLRCWL